MVREVGTTVPYRLRTPANDGNAIAVKPPQKVMAVSVSFDRSAAFRGSRTFSMSQYFKCQLCHERKLASLPDVFPKFYQDLSAVLDSDSRWITTVCLHDMIVIGPWRTSLDRDRSLVFSSLKLKLFPLLRFLTIVFGANVIRFETVRKRLAMSCRKVTGWRHSRMPLLLKQKAGGLHLEVIGDWPYMCRMTCGWSSERKPIHLA